MKLTDLRPCDNCNGPVGIIFEVVTVRKAMVKAESVRQAQGGALAHGFPVGLSEVMGVVRDADDAVVVAGVGEAGEEFKDLVTEIRLCQNCTTEPIVLAALVDRRNVAKPETT